MHPAIVFWFSPDISFKSTVFGLSVNQSLSNFQNFISAESFKNRYHLGAQPLLPVLIQCTLMRFSDLKETSLLTPFLKNSDKFRKLYFLALLGEIGGNIPKTALLLGVWENFFLKFWPKNYFFQAKTEFCNFYIHIYEYLKPDFKNLISGLSESVKKCAKNWKL